MIDKEDFATWRANAVTQAVFKALTLTATEAKDRWMASSWHTGAVDERLLADLRARAEMAEDIVGLTIEELNERLEAE